ncbi:unnamed protein product [Caenorhabditis auriculariae]|uniref:Metalloendopeptidase n=1 Tax=Caenorhabditis auriculariae TaxID=2777116 RepID=A0A8S1GRU6_9PELO|nr:unnamed protein product [Caenorhabditis auriculariae]
MKTFFLLTFVPLFVFSQPPDFFGFPDGPPPPFFRHRHRFGGPPPFGPPPFGPPPFRRRWGPFPPPDFPPMQPEPPETQPPAPVIPEPQPPSISGPIYTQQIDSVISSINSHTAAFQQPGQSYDQVLQVMKQFYGRKANTEYDIAKVQLPMNGLNNELSANRAVAPALFESDMVLTVSQIKKIASDGFRVKRKMNVNGTTWSTSVSYRFLDTDAEWQKQIKSALNYFERNTCIRFRQNGPGTDYIAFNRGEGCYSSVGRLGGAQEISIGYGCETLGIISHEVSHALGFWHEQARPERDSYVRIRFDNIVQGTQGQFDKRRPSEVRDYGIPYDYGSVMHYAAQSFSQSSALNAIETVDPHFMSTIGNRVEPSFLDLKLLNKAFCAGVCRNQLRCQHGGYPDPNSCGKCKCPTGLEGTFCEKLQTSNCGVELPAAGSRWRNISYSGTSDCYWRVQAPNNGKVRFELTYVMYKCNPVCEEFVEIKYDTNHETTGFRECCRATKGELISRGSSIIIISKAAQNSQFVLRYKLEGGAPPRPNRTLPKASTWSGWSSCSEKCGACGTQYRTRGQERQSRACDTQPCTPGTTRGKRSLYREPRAYIPWCCARFILKNNVCVPVR